MLGLTGAGGSVLAVPLLAVFLHLPSGEATGLALGVVAVSAAWGAVGRIIDKQVLWIPALLFGASGMVFAPAGRWLSALADPLMLKIAFVVLSLTIAGRMFWQSWHQPEQARLLRADGGSDAAEPLLFGWGPAALPA